LNRKIPFISVEEARFFRAGRAIVNEKKAKMRLLQRWGEMRLRLSGKPNEIRFRARKPEGAGGM